MDLIELNHYLIKILASAIIFITYNYSLKKCLESVELASRNENLSNSFFNGNNYILKNLDKIFRSVLWKDEKMLFDFMMNGNNMTNTSFNFFSRGFWIKNMFRIIVLLNIIYIIQVLINVFTGEKGNLINFEVAAFFIGIFSLFFHAIYFPLLNKLINESAGIPVARKNRLKVHLLLLPIILIVTMESRALFIILNYLLFNSNKEELTVKDKID